MSTCRLGPEDALSYEHRPPRAAAGVTFVFFNALTGDAASWEAVIGPALREQGHGTLVWNFRGQKDSPFGGPAAIGSAQIVADALRLLEASGRSGRSTSASRSAGCSPRRRISRVPPARGCC
jgi:hypothetical protein